MQEIQNYLGRVASYGWRVPLELLLIGLAIYVVMRFIRGTRGARLLKGAGVVLVVTYVVINLVAERLGLERVQFLYGRLLIGILFALVIVFQPELRHMLMRVGETRLFRSWQRQVNVMVEQIIDAVGYLSENKIGSLIAIERESGLSGLAEAGVKVDAVVSADLLKTIFWPGSALHDMGVVVSQGRLTAAGVQFPLAESGELPQTLGSRHRAALGLSNDCDALIIVVSEETGTISLADRGELIRPLTAERLRKLLLDRLAAATPPPTAGHMLPIETDNGRGEPVAVESK